MGNWFSQVPKAEGTVEVNIDNNGTTHSINYHGDTLAWTLGIIAFLALAAGTLYFLYRHKNARQKLLIQAVRAQERQEQNRQEHQLLKIASSQPAPMSPLSISIPMPAIPMSPPKLAPQPISPTMTPAVTPIETAYKLQQYTGVPYAQPSASPMRALRYH